MGVPHGKTVLIHDMGFHSDIPDQHIAGYAADVEEGRCSVTADAEAADFGVIVDSRRMGYGCLDFAMKPSGHELLVLEAILGMTSADYGSLVEILGRSFAYPAHQ